MGSGKKKDSLGWMGQALVTAAIFALPIIATVRTAGEP
jgi:hypothetical protein